MGMSIEEERRGELPARLSIARVPTLQPDRASHAVLALHVLLHLGIDAPEQSFLFYVLPNMDILNTNLHLQRLQSTFYHAVQCCHLQVVQPRTISLLSALRKINPGSILHLLCQPRTQLGLIYRFLDRVRTPPGYTISLELRIAELAPRPV